MSKELDDLMKATAIEFAEWANSTYIICHAGWMLRYSSKPNKYSSEELWEIFNNKENIK